MCFFDGVVAIEVLDQGHAGRDEGFEGHVVWSAVVVACAFECIPRLAEIVVLGK